MKQSGCYSATNSRLIFQEIVQTTTENRFNREEQNEISTLLLTILGNVKFNDTNHQVKETINWVINEDISKIAKTLFLYHQLRWHLTGNKRNKPTNKLTVMPSQFVPQNNAHSPLSMIVLSICNSCARIWFSGSSRDFTGDKC